MSVQEGEVWQPYASRGTMGTVIEGASERYERFHDRPFEETENGVSGGREKGEDHGKGGQVELRLSSELCGG